MEERDVEQMTGLGLHRVRATTGKKARYAELGSRPSFLEGDYYTETAAEVDEPAPPLPPEDPPMYPIRKVHSEPMPIPFEDIQGRTPDSPGQSSDASSPTSYRDDDSITSGESNDEVFVDSPMSPVRGRPRSAVVYVIGDESPTGPSEKERRSASEGKPNKSPMSKMDVLREERLRNLRRFSTSCPAMPKKVSENIMIIWTRICPCFPTLLSLESGG